MKLPKVMLGSSPFIGAGQFGVKAFEYYWRFYQHPENIAEIAVHCWRLGVKAVQLLACEPLTKGILMAEKRIGEKFQVVGTLDPDDPLEALKLYDGLEIVGLVFHASTSDLLDKELLTRLRDYIKRRIGCPVGAATHAPLRFLSWFRETELELDFVMVPFNVRGIFMDGKPEELVKLLREVGVKAVAKKVLAAGKLKPKEALEYVAGFRDVVERVALGITSKEEAEETMPLALKLFECR